MSATFLQVALGFFQKGNLCGPQRHHVSVQKTPLGLSFPKTQMARKVGVALGAAIDRCDVLSHPALVDQPCSTRSLYGDEAGE